MDRDQRSSIVWGGLFVALVACVSRGGLLKSEAATCSTHPRRQPPTRRWFIVKDIMGVRGRDLCPRSTMVVGES